MIAFVRLEFQLTRLMRGVTESGNKVRSIFRFQLTRLMRGVTLIRNNAAPFSTFQLTRLMRGVTFRAVAHTARMANFNSHASCEA